MNLGEAAAKFREMASRAESELATVACEAAAKDYLAILRVTTPKRTGRLMESERIDAITGGGLHATAVIAPHTVYAAFRDQGGTISAHYGEVWKTPKGGTRARMYRHTLHWEGGGFPLHVTQAGSHYMARARGLAAGPVAEACRRAADEFFTL